MRIYYKIKEKETIIESTRRPQQKLKITIGGKVYRTSHNSGWIEFERNGKHVAKWAIGMLAAYLLKLDEVI